MKAYYLALLFLCIQVGMGIITLQGVFDSKVEYDQLMLNTMTNNYDSIDPYSSSIDNELEYVSEDPSLVQKGIGLLDSIMTCLLPNFLLEKTIGISRAIALLASIPIYLIYFIGLAQFFGALKGGQSAI